MRSEKKGDSLGWHRSD